MSGEDGKSKGRATRDMDRAPSTGSCSIPPGRLAERPTEPHSEVVIRQQHDLDVTDGGRR